MVFNANEKYASSTQGALPRALSTSTRPKTMAGTGSELTLARLTPLTYNATSKKFELWEDDDTVDGFAWPDLEQVLPANTDDNLVMVMLAGTVHYEDVVLPTGETQSNLKTQLQNPLVRQKGFTIDGLAGAG